MGRTFQYECPQCQYRASVSGGADRGLNCSIQTILCRDCRRLFDVFTRLRQTVEETPPRSGPARLLPAAVTVPPLQLTGGPGSVSTSRAAAAAVRAWKWIELKAACPVAENHRIELWGDPGRCPRCGNYLEKNAYPYRLWD